MIKNFILFFGLVSSFLFAQNTRFIYQVSMKTDSTSQHTVENAYLDVSVDKSVFYGEKRMRRDSIMRKAFETRNFNFDRAQMDQYRTQINYQIEKDLKTQKITFKNRIARDQYSYDEDRSFNWKILQETNKIGEYKVQKAESDFGGRKWIAWFTQDVSVMDGPYKFSGLPGLIVKIEDVKGDYSFDLKETKKIGELPTFQQRGGNTITLDRKDYEKQMEKFQKDPASFMQNTMMIGGGFRMDRVDGNPQDEIQRRKQKEERMKEDMKKNNNPLEK